MSNSNKRSVQDLEAEKREFEDLFAMPAWKKFVDAKQAAVDNLNTNWEDRFVTNEDLHVARGYIKALKVEVLALEAIVEANFNKAIEEAKTGLIDVPPEDM